MLKTFTSDLRHNLIKIFCLSTGLAIGMLLVAKVYFEKTFDTFLPDAEKIHIVSESVTTNGEYKEYAQTAGGIAPALKRYVPQIENATRFIDFFGDQNVSLPDGRRFATKGIALADSCFFDVFRQKTYLGDPHEVLAVEWNCMIPQSLAEKMGEDVIGKALTSQAAPGMQAVIGGIYEDFPENSVMKNQIYMSLSTIGHFAYDGRENMIGNDSYKSYVTYSPDISYEDIKPNIRRMLTENLPKEVLEQSHYNILTEPLVGYYASQPGVRTMDWILTALATIILLSASLNYLLIVLGQMQWRAKEMAVRKCFGTGNRKIFSMILGESLAYMIVSLALAVLIIASLKKECLQLLGVDAFTLLMTDRIWILDLIVCLVMLAITGILPAWLFCRTPVSGAFRKSGNGKKFWKLALLSVQFFVSGFLFCFLVLIMRQYRMIDNADLGYDYKDVAIADINTIPEENRQTLISELRRLGSVERVATATMDFSQWGSGNNLWPAGHTEKQYNYSEMYNADPEIFPLLGIKFLQGKAFDALPDTISHKIVVEEKLIGVINRFFDGKGDHIIGQKYLVSEHHDSNGNNEYEICGVVPDMRRGGFTSHDSDPRPAIIYPTDTPQRTLYVRFKKLEGETLAQAQEVIDRLFPDKEIVIFAMKDEIDTKKAPVKHFGTSVMIAGIIIILITLVGLIGYTANEVNRRAKEIAIRKVNGMSVGDILKIFVKDILFVAIPSLLLGFIGAIIIGKRWLGQFTDQVSLSPLSMLGTVTVILVILAAVVIAACLRVAKANPVNYLRDE